MKTDRPIRVKHYHAKPQIELPVPEPSSAQETKALFLHSLTAAKALAQIEPEEIVDLVLTASVGPEDALSESAQDLAGIRAATYPEPIELHFDASILPLMSLQYGVCPFCQSVIDADQPTIQCPECKAVYHLECWSAFGDRCSVLGCSGRRILNREPDLDKSSP